MTFLRLVLFEELMQKTMNQINKNLLLRKYEFVLCQQLVSGDILKSKDVIQYEVIANIANSRFST